MIWFILFSILPKRTSESTRMILRDSHSEGSIKRGMAVFLNALLGMLNARKSLREHMGDVVISLRLTSTVQDICPDVILAPSEV